MHLLITLLIYIIGFAVVYYLLNLLMTELGASTTVVKGVRIIVIAIAIIMVLMLFFGQSYIDLPRFREVK